MFELIIGAGLVLAIALIGYFIFWLKTKAVTLQDMKDIYEKLEEVGTNVNELTDVVTQVVQGKAVEVKVADNGHEPEVVIKELSLNEALSQIAKPAPRVSKEEFKERMRKGREAKKGVVK